MSRKSHHHRDCCGANVESRRDDCGKLTVKQSVSLHVLRQSLVFCVPAFSDWHRQELLYFIQQVFPSAQRLVALGSAQMADMLASGGTGHLGKQP